MRNYKGKNHPFHRIFFASLKGSKIAEIRMHYTLLIIVNRVRKY